MNINNVYECNVYKYEFSEFEYDNYDENNIERNIVNFIIIDENLSALKTLKKYILFVKKTIVYYSEKYDCFIDLETNEKYSIGMSSLSENDNLFIDVRKPKIYGKDLMDSKRKHFTKRKILKRYNLLKGEIHECK